MRFKRMIAGVACAAALTNFSSAPTHGRQRIEIPATASEEIADASKFDPIPSVSWVCLKPVKRCGEQILKGVVSGGYGDPGAEAKRTVKEENFSLDGGVTVFLATVMDGAGESVAGERFRAEFVKLKKGYKFVRLGRQYKCVRGPKEWTKQLCS